VGVIKKSKVMLNQTDLCQSHDLKLTDDEILVIRGGECLNAADFMCGIGCGDGCGTVCGVSCTGD
jgi:hypothetical protein